MNSVILCEGKTDAILISYLLRKTCGWEIENNRRAYPNSINIKAYKNNESFYWYKKEGSMLAIWGVGGKDNFKNALPEIASILRNAPEDQRFKKVVIIGDRDNTQNENDIIVDWLSCFGDINPIISISKFTENTYNNSFGQQVSFKTMSIIIPPEKTGALETVLLDSISEEEYNRAIVNRCNDFIEQITAGANKYIKTDRLKLKAKLSTVFAVMSPEKVFDFIDNLLINTFKWEDSEVLNELFNKLNEI